MSPFATPTPRRSVLAGLILDALLCTEIVAVAVAFWIITP